MRFSSVLRSMKILQLQPSPKLCPPSLCYPRPPLLSCCTVVAGKQAVPNPRLCQSSSINRTTTQNTSVVIATSKQRIESIGVGLEQCPRSASERQDFRRRYTLFGIVVGHDVLSHASPLVCERVHANRLAVEDDNTFPAVVTFDVISAIPSTPQPGVLFMRGYLAASLLLGQEIVE
ncbi:hypothetical protein BKA70DRAFT_814067 [Coprinopsis sp. MPI-PUGE-AT-0042]|nr:hypothetical protein BKA70DRAFT_814067 [Coprinopsis sp. MPI-PUGE-AT-0042]